MSASNRICRRRLSAASIAATPEPQKSPWWTISRSARSRGCQLEQLGVRGDAGGDRLDLRRPGHLQAVDAVVLEASGLEQAVELLPGSRTSGAGIGRDDSGPAGVEYCRRVGAWRSLVARTVRVGEVPGSNPGAPITEVPARAWRTHGCVRGRSRAWPTDGATCARLAARPLGPCRRSRRRAPTPPALRWSLTSVDASENATPVAGGHLVGVHLWRYRRRVHSQVIVRLIGHHDHPRAVEASDVLDPALIEVQERHDAIPVDGVVGAPCVHPAQCCAALARSSVLPVAR